MVIKLRQEVDLVATGVSLSLCLLISGFGRWRFARAVIEVVTQLLRSHLILISKH